MERHFERDLNELKERLLWMAAWRSALCTGRAFRAGLR